MELLIQHWPEITSTVQDTFDSNSALIDGEENDVCTMRARTQPVLQFAPLNIAKRRLRNLTSVLEQLVFKLTCAFGIIESDEIGDFGKIHLGATRKPDAHYLTERL